MCLTVLFLEYLFIVLPRECNQIHYICLSLAGTFFSSWCCVYDTTESRFSLGVVCAQSGTESVWRPSFECVELVGGETGEQIVISVSWVGRNKLRPAGVETYLRLWASASFMIVTCIVFSCHSRLISSFHYSLDTSSVLFGNLTATRISFVKYFYT